jgi:zinc transport system substrate-binding protein
MIKYQLSGKGRKKKPRISMNAIVLLRTITVAAMMASFAIHAEERMKIVVTSFPLYDWTRQVAGETSNRFDLEFLQKNGTDLHSYQPTSIDLVKVARCDLFICIGGESDEWSKRALMQKDNPRRRTLNLLKVLGAAVKMEEDHGNEHHHGDKHHHDDEHNNPDEHIWLSLRHAAKLSSAIAKELSSLDPENATNYLNNVNAYNAKLTALDRAYADTIAQSVHKTLLVADRFPFRYLADDYGLAYFAAFPGCSAESEASFKTIAFLAQKADALELPAILTLESSNGKIAKTVRNATKQRAQKILTLDSLQSVDEAHAKTVTYLDVMTRNLATLKSALN